jgi:SAM-dependent methyltransferase
MYQIPTLTVLGQNRSDLIREALRAFLVEDTSTFLQLFVKQQPVHADSARTGWWLSMLQQVGLMTANSNGCWEAQHAVYPLGDILIVTDCWRYGGHDRVFPITHENLCFIGLMRTPERGLALDIGTGSGIFAIFIARKGLSVVGVDTNPRALALAGFNAKLNNVESRIALVRGSLGSSFRDGVFDYICCNLPFVPVPPGVTTFEHSYGGPTGRAVLEQILPDVGNLLKPEGIFQMLVIDTGTAETPWLVKQRQHYGWFHSSRIVVEYLDKPVPLSDWLENMRQTLNWQVSEEDWACWIDWLHRQGMTYAHYMVVTVERGQPPDMIVRDASKYAHQVYLLLKLLRRGSLEGF